MRTKKSRIAVYAVLAAVLALCFLPVACGGSGGGGGGGGGIIPGVTPPSPPSPPPPPPCVSSVTVNLRAGSFVKSLPDGSTVTMWGYAQDTAFGSGNGTLSVPGPVINLSQCTDTLTVTLKNDLPVPTSFVINGLTAQMTPVYVSGRVRSFTQETPPGNTSAVQYVFHSLRPGTFLYMSGTSPQIQVQMGLYGPMTRLAGDTLAYPGVAFNSQLAAVYSEIDPVIHQAVATDNYGPGKAVTSTVGFRPKYLLVNGSVADPGACADIPPAAAGQKLLVRFLNAGLVSRAPNLIGARFSVIGEDGNPHPLPLSELKQ